MDKQKAMALGYDLDDDAGFEPWALGDHDLEDDEDVDSGDNSDGPSGADGWLDEELGRLGSRQAVGDEVHDGDPTDANASPSAGRSETAPDHAAGDGDDVVLRRSAPTRPPRRRRRADAAAAADLPAAVVPGYVRDRRGTWRYSATGRTVPGARDLTLRSLYRFPVSRPSVLVPVDLIRTETELAWCMAWKQTLTTALSGGRVQTMLRIPVGEWERRADIPIGLWAPELAASRLLGIGDVARVARVTAATITAYLSGGGMPPPVSRIGHSPVWSRPVIEAWLAGRPGQGVRRREPPRRTRA
jgi:hypothetical protein